MKPTKKSFGWNNWSGWTSKENQDAYYEALKAWENRPRNAVLGRKRTREIHPSWNNVLQYFDSTTPLRSQGAFCRWADLNRATFSAMQCKPVQQWVIDEIASWISETEKEVENETARSI